MADPADKAIATNFTTEIATVIGCCKRDPVSIASLAARAVDNAYTFIQRLPFIKLKKYFDDVANAEDDLGAACRLSDKIFSDPKKATDNALRIIKYVTDLEESKKFKWFNNTTRALLLECIDQDTFFRIFKAIDDTMADDLEYLAFIIEKNDVFKGNVQIQALAQNGLMISAGVDANVGIEDQDYAVTRLGYLVDQYAISFGNDARQLWYKASGPQPIKPSMPGEPTFEAIPTGDNDNTLVIGNRGRK